MRCGGGCVLLWSSCEDFVRGDSRGVCRSPVTEYRGGGGSRQAEVWESVVNTLAHTRPPILRLRLN